MEWVDGTGLQNEKNKSYANSRWNFIMQSKNSNRYQPETCFCGAETPSEVPRVGPHVSPGAGAALASANRGPGPTAVGRHQPRPCREEEGAGTGRTRRGSLTRASPGQSQDSAAGGCGPRARFLHRV